MATSLTKPVQYKVKRGDTLIKVCKSYGLKDSDAVWNDKDNEKIKKLRKKPEAIQPDDLIVLNPQGPSSTEVKETLKEIDGMIASLENKLANLQEAKKSLLQSKNQIISELAASYKQAKSTGDKTDAAATVALIIVDLTKLASKAHKAIELSGDALEAANREMLKEVGKMKLQQARDIGAEIVSDIEPKNSAALNALIATADAWKKMTSPSFWAYAYVKGMDEWKNTGSIPKAWAKGVTADPKADYQEAVGNVERQIAANLGKLDAAIGGVQSRIQQTKKDRAQYEKTPQ